jgi:hypothetical protein
MARSVEAVEDLVGAELADQAAFEGQLREAITGSRTQIQSMSPASRLGWLGQALTELGLDTKRLAGARRLAETEQQLNRRLYERQALAVQRRQDALKTLADSPDGSFDGPVAQFAAEAPWLDREPDKQHPIAAGMIKQAQRLVAGQLDGAIVGQAGHSFGA